MFFLLSMNNDFPLLCIQVLVPVANESEEMEALSIIYVLRRAKATVTVASVEDTLEITGRRKVKIVADMLIDDAAKSQYDLIVLPVSVILYLKYEHIY